MDASIDCAMHMMVTWSHYRFRVTRKPRPQMQSGARGRSLHQQNLRLAARCTLSLQEGKGMDKERLKRFGLTVCRCILLNLKIVDKMSVLRNFRGDFFSYDLVIIEDQKVVHSFA